MCRFEKYLVSKINREKGKENKTIKKYQVSCLTFQEILLQFNDIMGTEKVTRTISAF